MTGVTPTASVPCMRRQVIWAGVCANGGAHWPWAEDRALVLERSCDLDAAQIDVGFIWPRKPLKRRVLTRRVSVRRHATHADCNRFLSPSIAEHEPSAKPGAAEQAP